VLEPGYRTAFIDWLACAAGGWEEPAAVAARGVDQSLLGRIAALGAAGHVLDFDDTYAPGLVHCTAPVAPAALVLGAESDRSMGDVLAAFAQGWEATAALARASHPALYRRGWHPTSVCGVVGAARASAAILGLDEARTEAAIDLSLVQAGGLLAAFGSDAKALQVGLASGAGARAALLAANGASAPAGVRVGFQAAYGATWAEPDRGRPSIRENWIKAYPCCLQTHSAIEAAELARTQGVEGGPIVVRVHPISLQAAPYPVPTTPLEAKFSIPYTVAFTVLHSPPRVEDFRSLDPEAAELSAHVEAVPDEHLSQSEAVLEAPGLDPIRVEAALGSPERPMDPVGLRAKVASLAGEVLERLVSDDASARSVVEFLSEARVTGSQRGPGSGQ
jgi:2-methylcitrate dehydratase PrpD